MLTPDWKTASLNNGTCVEARLDPCGSSACVETREFAGAAQVRDSKDQAGPVLTFASADWAEFLGGIRDGEFDPC